MEKILIPGNDKGAGGRTPAILAAALIVAIGLVSTSCGSPRTGLRSLAPSDTVVYLETPDLGRLLATMSQQSQGKGVTHPDFSSLNGVEVAVAVSGFEASQSKVTDQESVLNFQPQFTLIAETHAWEWQVESLVTGVLGDFIAGRYGPGTKLERSDRDGVSWFVWSAEDGRKAFAAAAGSQVYFGNNEDGIKACLNTRSGGSESLLSNESLSRQYENAGRKLAFGFVTEEGVRQLSEFAGVSMAIDRTDDAGAQSVISSIFPQLISNSVREVVWTSSLERGMIEDTVNVRIAPKIAEAFSESMRPSPSADDGVMSYVPHDARSVTRYNLADPRIAFRSLVIAAADRVSPQAARFVPVLGASLLEPYGVDDPEAFLALCRSFIVTVQFDEAGDESAAVVSTDDFEALRAELADGFKSRGDGTFLNEDLDLAMIRRSDIVVIGDPVSAKRAAAAADVRPGTPGSSRITMSPMFASVRRPEHPSVSVYRDDNVSIFGKVVGAATPSFGMTITDFESSGIRRTYRSKLGIPGSLISQFYGGE